jgi:uncharacterized protein (DUF1501 family)
MLNYATENDHVLVIIQLNGGNDGLNTVIPLDGYASYFNARSNIAIPEKKVLRVKGSDAIGFHPSMTGMQSLFNDGKLSVIQAVGYPNPNFSHFRATDIWMSASDANKVVNSGWSGRFLNEEYQNYPVGYPNQAWPDPPAIQIGSLASLVLQGPAVNMGMSISSTTFYNLVKGVQDPAPATRVGKELTYIRTVAQQTQQYSTSIKEAASKVTQQAPYPENNGLAEQLKIVARLIKGGLKTRVYLTTIGGFDTHSLQVAAADTTTGPHALLLKTLSDAIKGFMDDCQFLNIDRQVVGMTFSEFGRRIKSNSSLGTDHGAAAPMFVFGGMVQGGVVGKNPEILPSATVNDNIPYQYDFRSVYASILENWFCASNTTIESVLFRNFQSLPIIKGQACNPTTDDPNKDPSVNFVSNYPNPFSTSTKVTFNVKNGHVLIQVMDVQGKLIANLVDADFPDGTHSTSFDGSRIAAGVYYLRFQNGPYQQVKLILKVK